MSAPLCLANQCCNFVHGLQLHLWNRQGWQSSLSSKPTKDLVSEALLYKFLQPLTMTVLVLLNITTNVPLGERFKESLRTRDNLKRTWSRKPSFARTAFNAFASLAAFTAVLEVASQLLTPILFPFTPLWWLFQFLFLLGVRPVDPGRTDRYGEVAIMWPKAERTYFRRKLRPPQHPVFKFLKEWLSDPVHIKMLAYMTSDLAHDPSDYKAAEDRCIWLLNRADWRHEVRRLSTESELLERQVVERSNFNTLKRLVQCRKTTKRVKDGIKEFCDYTPALAGDWTPIIQSWANQQQARSDQHRRQQADDSLQQDGELPDATSTSWLRDVWGAHVSPELQGTQITIFPTLQTERNPIELLYWKTRTERLWEPEETADLTLGHVEDTLSRSLSLLQDAIAVQTSDRALWLALIATFYFPATLATGIFGMNLSLIDGKPFWWAIVICAILFIPNVVFLIYVFWRR
jgi:hypothetical protein